MTALQSIIAYNQAGRVGSSSIYQATVADRMVEVSQANNRRRVQPAAVIHINLNRICNEIY